MIMAELFFTGSSILRTFNSFLHDRHKVVDNSAQLKETFEDDDFHEREERLNHSNISANYPSFSEQNMKPTQPSSKESELKNMTDTSKDGNAPHSTKETFQNPQNVENATNATPIHFGIANYSSQISYQDSAKIFPLSPVVAAVKRAEIQDEPGHGEGKNYLVRFFWHCTNLHQTIFALNKVFLSFSMVQPLQNYFFLLQ